MDVKVLIPKRYRTASRCLRELMQRRRVFQSELKRLVYPKSWSHVVKPEFALWNAMIQEEYPGHCLIVMTSMRNPKTRRTNEVLYSLPSELELVEKRMHFVGRINRGESK